jgi:hypothetical protein
MLSFFPLPAIEFRFLLSVLSFRQYPITRSAAFSLKFHPAPRGGNDPTGATAVTVLLSMTSGPLCVKADQVPEFIQHWPCIF